jgi:hypothetical protein
MKPEQQNPPPQDQAALQPTTTAPSLGPTIVNVDAFTADGRLWMSYDLSEGCPSFMVVSYTAYLDSGSTVSGSVEIGFGQIIYESVPNGETIQFSYGVSEVQNSTCSKGLGIIRSNGSVPSR